MFRFARYAVAACVLFALGGLGCQARATVPMFYPHATKGTLAQSPHEHYQFVSNIAAQDERALIDDLDLLFQTDRPTRLTRWLSR